MTTKLTKLKRETPNSNHIATSPIHTNHMLMKHDTKWLMSSMISKTKSNSSIINKKINTMSKLTQIAIQLASQQKHQILTKHPYTNGDTT